MTSLSVVTSTGMSKPYAATAIVPNSSANIPDPLRGTDGDGDYELVQIRRSAPLASSSRATSTSFFDLPAVKRGMQSEKQEIVACKREEEKEKPRRHHKAICAYSRAGNVLVTVPSDLSKELRSSMRGLLNPNLHYNFRIVLNSQIVSTAGGVIDSTTMIVPMDPSGSAEWTSLATLFDEFRVLSIESHWQPRGLYHGPDGTYNGTATVFGLDNAFASGFDNDSLPTATTIDAVMTYAESHYGNTAKPHRYHFHRPNVTPSAYWVDCAVPSQSLGGVVVFAGLLNASVPYGQSLRVWHIQLRMRQ